MIYKARMEGRSPSRHLEKDIIILRSPCKAPHLHGGWTEFSMDYESDRRGDTECVDKERLGSSCAAFQLGCQVWELLRGASSDNWRSPGVVLNSLNSGFCVNSTLLFDTKIEQAYNDNFIELKTYYNSKAESTSFEKEYFHRIADRKSVETLGILHYHH